MSTFAIDTHSLDVQELAADHQTLELSAEVDRDDIATWRQYDRPGEANTTVGANGEFRTIDRSGGAQPVVSVDPPTEWQPEPLDVHNAIVTDYSETRAAPDRYELELTLTRTQNRDRVVTEPSSDGFGSDPFGRYFSYTSGSRPWEVTFSRAPVGLDREEILLGELEGDPAGGSWTLPILVDDRRARIIMESLSHVDAVAERAIPDATNRIVDTTSGDWNTVTISNPSSGQLLDGSTDAVVTEWGLEWYSHRRWRVDLSLTTISP